MKSMKYWLIYTVAFACISGASPLSAQDGDLRSCLRRLETAVSERQGYLRSIDDQYLNEDDRNFVGSQRITSYSVSIDGSMDVERNLEDCEYAAENYEHFNGRLREIANASAGNKGGY